MKPFYDPYKTYIKNYEEGPFNAFVDHKIYKQKGKPQYDFLDQKIYLPFGIPAGPLLNSVFIKAAFEKGFDLCVYKTVRTSIFPCHPYPNLLAIHKAKISVDNLDKPIETDKQFSKPLSITNSFGVPSKDPTIWQEDAKKAISYTKEGQVMILSFMGTVRSGQTANQFVEDFILAARLAKETGAKVLEANLSCPNIGNAGLVCYMLTMTEKIVKGIRKVIGNTPLILKVGYYKNNNDLEKLAKIANEYANDIAGINTLQSTIVNKKGEQALPGQNRLRSGICGSGIKWAGLETVKKLKIIKDKNNYKYSITGVGGVVIAKDYQEYINAGANAVMSATGAMWNPNLAIEIKQKLKV
jgi:dihydroorotate dehydrogenase (NAD+) catalytic subunit